MLCIDGYVYKDVERGNLGCRDWDQAAVGIVDQKITSQRPCSVVIDAARAIGDISHYQRLRAGTELCKDIRYGRGEHEEAFGELEGNSLRFEGSYAVDRLGYLETVIVRQ